MLWKLLYGLIIIGISKYGDHIEECPRGNYSCPSYCDIDHKHNFEVLVDDEARPKRTKGKAILKTSL